MLKIFALIAASAAIFAPVAHSIETPVQTTASITQVAETRSPEEILRSATQKYESQDLQGALAELDELIRLRPDVAVGYVNRGNVRDDLGNPQGALDDYDKALSIDRQDYSTYFNRGITYARLEKYPEAISDLQTAIKLKADHAIAHRNLGMIKYINATTKAEKEAGIADVRKSAVLFQKQGQESKARESNEIAQKMKQALTETN